MVKVKICGLTNLNDARHAADCGADLLGFIFVPASPRCVSATLASGIIAALRASGCKAGMVGVFADEDPAKAKTITECCKLDFVQLHGQESPDYTRQLGISVFVARRVTNRIPWDELSTYHAEAYLLDSYQASALGGTGVTWSWDALADAPQDARIILAGGLNPDNVTDALTVAGRLGVRLWGVDVSSGVERSPGLKDPDKVSAFIKAARGASE